MTAPSQVETIAEQLELGITLLERLHVLSQTLALTLETRNAEDLETVVEAKALLIERLGEVEARIAAAMRMEVVPVGSVALAGYREKALGLIDRISAADASNAKQLAAFKQDAIARSHTLQEERKLLGAYGQL